MLVNILSTPRTGSVWFTHHTSKNYNNPSVFFGLFEPAMNSYYKIKNSDGSGSYISDYRPDAFYYDYFLDESQNLRITKVFQERTLPYQEQIQLNFEKFKIAVKHQTIVLDHHVGYEDNNITKYLIDHAQENIWIHRKNKRNQLASFVVALSTGRFTVYDKNHILTDAVPDIEVKYLESLLRKIKIWDSLNKGSDRIVAFEELNFYDSPGFPVDANTNAWSRIGENMKTIIDQLLVEYEKS